MVDEIDAFAKALRKNAPFVPAWKCRELSEIMGVEIPDGVADLRAQIVTLTAERDAYVRAIDEAKIVRHIGVFSHGDDIAKALNGLGAYDQSVGEYFAKEAAEARAADLERENGELREALKPFAEFAEVAKYDVGNREADQDIFRPMIRHNCAGVLLVGHLRRAAALVARTESSADES